MSSEVPLLTEKQIEDAWFEAAENFRRYQAGGARGQMVVMSDTPAYHDARAIEQAVRAQWAAEVNNLTDVLHRNGFVRCDIAACNCGSWHARFGYPERFREFTEALEEHGASMHAGKTALTILKEMLAQRDSAQAEAKRLREALAPLVENEGRSSFAYLDKGIGTNTADGRRWLAARAALQPGAQP